MGQSDRANRGVFFLSSGPRGSHHFRMEGVVTEWNSAKLCDVANLVLGAILFISSWIFGSGPASQNAFVCGVVIVVISLAALAAFAVWEEWLNLILGLWLVIAPWVLGFTGTAATNVHVAVGSIVAILAAIELWLLHQGPPWRTSPG
jgi:hypothetical protein